MRQGFICGIEYKSDLRYDNLRYHVINHPDEKLYEFDCYYEEHQLLKWNNPKYIK